MRSHFNIGGDGAGTAVVALAAFVFFLYFAASSARVSMWVYPVVRSFAQARINFETRDMLAYETPHFIVKYTPADAGIVHMVAKAAEAAYNPVTAAVGLRPSGKTLVVIYPDKSEMRKAFGWSGDESAMGAYWGGVVEVLSPRVWLKEGQGTAEFIRSGPMVHEFTHLVFDHLTRGNYPRWFTEGLAQYVEYRTTGYEWISSTNSLKKSPLYTMEELDTSFDSLPNQALAYRESLAAVRYIAEVYGEAKLHAVFAGLAAGRPMDQAIKAALGIDYQDFAAAWPIWAASHMKDRQDR